MKIYLVQPDPMYILELNQRFGRKPNVMVSFADVGTHFSYFTHAYRPRIGKLMLDCGAYSEMKGTAKVELESYGNYLKPCAALFNYCIAFDLPTEDYDARMWNLARLQKVARNLLPVVHDPFAGEIDSLYDMGHHYILLGSSQGNDRKQLDFIFRRYYYSERFPGLRFHKLGTATYPTLSAYPFYSSDSAGYAIVGGQGKVVFWNNAREPNANGDRTDKFYCGGRDIRGNAEYRPYTDHPHLGEFEDYVWSTFRYRISDIIGPSKSDQRKLVNAKYTLDLEEVLTKLHGI